MSRKDKEDNVTLYYGEANQRFHKAVVEWLMNFLVVCDEKKIAIILKDREPGKLRSVFTRKKIKTMKRRGIKVVASWNSLNYVTDEITALLREAKIKGAIKVVKTFYAPDVAGRKIQVYHAKAPCPVTAVEILQQNDSNYYKLPQHIYTGGNVEKCQKALAPFLVDRGIRARNNI